MWENNQLTQMLKIKYPIVQAGMAGGVTTPELVAAVSNAGGLGTLGAGYMLPEQIRTAISDIRKLTDHPFAVNLFVIQAVENISQQKVVHMNKVLNEIRTNLNVPPVFEIPQTFGQAFEEQLQVVMEEQVPVFSFTFGCPSAEIIQNVKKHKTTVIGTATTVKEACILQENGVDIIVAQGSEAGGHRGTFTNYSEQTLIGTMALVPQIVDHVQIPVIASGGIMDGRSIVASLALGAQGVQMGTAFVTCRESGAHFLYKQAVLNSTEESTVITRSFSGKPARGIRNAFIEQMEEIANEIPVYPVQNTLTRDIRQIAAQQNNSDYMSLWAGQGSSLSTDKTANELILDLRTHIDSVMHKLDSI